MEDRLRLVVDVSVSETNGRVERTEALRLLRRSWKSHRLRTKTLAVDEGYTAGAFLHKLESDEGIVP